VHPVLIETHPPIAHHPVEGASEDKLRLKRLNWQICAKDQQIGHGKHQGLSIRWQH
jgi:hypothetical protein